MISTMLNTRKSTTVFGRGTTTFLDTQEEILAYIRKTDSEEVLVINNLSSGKQSISHPYPDRNMVILHAEGLLIDDDKQTLTLEPHGFAWFALL
jgi:glycosidase